MKMLDILAASSELSTPAARLDAAWQLSDAKVAGNPVDKFIDKLMADDVPEEKRGVSF